MITIIEGINNVGKTSLIRELRIRYSGIVQMNDTRHLFRYPSKYDPRNIIVSQTSMTLFVDLIKRFDLSKHRNLIFDRFHLTEAAYSSVFRNYDSENQILENYSKIDKMLCENFGNNIRLVLLIASYKELIKRTEGSKDRWIIENYYTELTKHMKSFYYLSNIKNKYIVDTGKEKNVERLIQEL